MAVIFGGGGSGAGLSNLVVQLAALVAIAFHRQAFFDFFTQAPRGFAVLIAATMLVPLLQCIPLPPVVWHGLPGRDLASQSLALVGQQDTWIPFSLNVRRTIIAFLALVPPLAILILTWRASDDDRRTLLTLLVACGVFEVVLGAQQLAFGNRHVIFYAEAFGTQDLHGTFANRNTAGLFADAALCALIGLLWHRHHSSLFLGLSGGAAALLAVGLLLTRSRSSITLGIIPLTMLPIYLWSFGAQIVSKRSRIVALIVVAVILAVSTLALASNERIQHSLSRFDSLQDARPAIWQDAKSSISRFWPVGSGIGTFDEVFQVDESLENLSPGRAARAHNEYLETVIESGILAPVLIVSWMMMIAVAARTSARMAKDRGPLATALTFFALLAFQSVLDYPLRSEALLCVAGLLLGFLIARTSVHAPSGPGTSKCGQFAGPTREFVRGE